MALLLLILITIKILNSHKEVDMSRNPGLYLIGFPQHVIQRGNNRESCFYGIAEEQDCYLIL